MRVFNKLRRLPTVILCKQSVRHIEEGYDFSDIAPKRKNKLSVEIPAKVNDAVNDIKKDAQVNSKFSTSELEDCIGKWNKMPPEQLDKMFQEFQHKEEDEAKVLESDGLMQMDISLDRTKTGPIKVFWKDTSINESEKFPGWFKVMIDNHPVRAFSSTKHLIVPGKDYALACAKEWAEQDLQVNKLLMPLTDAASGAMTIVPRGIESRIEYLLSFFQSDNCYFRSPEIETIQDEMIEPVTYWFERFADIKVPRIVGISHPKIFSSDAVKVKNMLLQMNMNHYQVVALCVLAQFSASLILPLALLYKVINLETILRINDAEEKHNTTVHGTIKGYHDIRQADVEVKIAAALLTWNLTSKVPMKECVRVFGDSQLIS